MPGGWLCITPAYAEGELNLIKVDIRGLNDWVEDYLIQGHLSLHFEILRFLTNPEICILFDESAPIMPERFKKRQMGSCKLLQVSEQSKGVFLADGLGGQQAGWSDHYRTHESFRASWVWLKQPPLDRWQAITESWDELEPLFPADVVSFLLEAERASVKVAGKKRELSLPNGRLPDSPI